MPPGMPLVLRRLACCVSKHCVLSLHSLGHILDVGKHDLCWEPPSSTELITAKSCTVLCRYGQAGTPNVKVVPTYDASARTLTLKVSQHTPVTPGQTEKAPVPIPLAVGLLASNGTDIPLHLQVWLL